MMASYSASLLEAEKLRRMARFMTSPVGALSCNPKPALVCREAPSTRSREAPPVGAVWLLLLLRNLC